MNRSEYRLYRALSRAEDRLETCKRILEGLMEEFVRSESGEWMVAVGDEGRMEKVEPGVEKVLNEAERLLYVMENADENEFAEGEDDGWM